MNNLISLVPSSLFDIRKIIVSFTAGILLTSSFMIYRYVENLKDKNSALESKITELTVNNEVLSRNNMVLKESLEIVNSSNLKNVDTIKKLLAERQGAQTAISNLASATVTDKKKIGDLETQIEVLLQDKKNDGEVSTVLRETIRGIQKIRK